MRARDVLPFFGRRGGARRHRHGAGRSLRRRALLLAAAILGAALLPGCGDGQAPRGVALPATAYKEKITVASPPKDLRAGQTTTLDVVVQNAGATPWPHEGRPDAFFSVVLSYHWLKPGGSTVVWDGLRTELPADLAPGASVSLKAKLQAPPTAGDYVLELDLVQENVAWFKDRGARTTRLPVTVS